MFIPQEYLNSPVCFGLSSMTTFSLNGKYFLTLKSGKTTSSRQFEGSLRMKLSWVVLPLGIEMISGEYPPSTVISIESITATSFLSFFIRKNQNTKIITKTPETVTILFVFWFFLMKKAKKEVTVIDSIDI